MEMLLIKMGEMVLKGLNRSKFESMLLSDLRTRITPYGEFSIETAQSAVYVTPNSETDIIGAFQASSRVFGIANLSRAYMCAKDIDSIAEAACKIENLYRIKTFKVEARRADKRFPMTSPQICEEIGARLLDAFPNLSVDVHSPEETVWVEIRENRAFVHPKPIQGAGGLPRGTAGKAVLLLSGGIDSPVAGWRMARRGLDLLPVHFYSYPYTSPEARDKVLTLASILAGWTGPLTVRVVPFTAIQEAIRRYTPETLATVLARRSMCRIASAIALASGAGAVVTGDSLGQVASQTLEALSATGSASDVALLRPLIGMDKEEIVVTARRIGTFETSILPYEDCCGIFTPKHPNTKPKIEAIIQAEAQFNYAELEREAVAQIEKIYVRGLVE